MKWVTRERPKTDRIACPWLIKNFIDPEAEFVYVPADQVLAVAEREGGYSYDAPGADLHPPRRALLVRGAARGVRARRPGAEAAGADRARCRRRRGPRRHAAVARPARGRGGIPPARTRRPPTARAVAAGLRRALCLVQERGRRRREPRPYRLRAPTAGAHSRASTTRTSIGEAVACTSRTPAPTASR